MQNLHFNEATGGLLAALRKIQDQHGYLSSENLSQLAQDMRIDEDQVYAVASYYPVFKLKAGPSVAGHSGKTPSALAQSVEQSEGQIHFLPTQGKILQRCGRSLKDYQGLKKARTLKPLEVIELVKRSGLRGRGGAGFPAATKWEFAQNIQADQRYVICNAAEGDLGAFMDRAILESDPHSVIEGLAIAAFAIGASKGYIYIRAEYGSSIPIVEKALKEARSQGILGAHFDVQTFFAAGMYVCGEETALLNSMEGKPGRPRHKPPFPAESGLWGKPTIVNNVKTLAQVALILREGADSFLAVGTGKSHGSAILSLSGHITNCGVTEVPMGTSLDTVIFKIGGGVLGGKKLKAIQTGGPLGGFIPASLIKIPITFEDFAVTGSPLGSGGMIVLDETTCMVAATRFFMDFTQEESCGHCAPCRLGTADIKRIMDGICEGRGTKSDLARLDQLSETMTLASFCAFGQGASNILVSALKHFHKEFEEHILEKKCACGFCDLGGGR